MGSKGISGPDAADLEVASTPVLRVLMIAAIGRISSRAVQRVCDSSEKGRLPLPGAEKQDSMKEINKIEIFINKIIIAEKIYCNFAI
jgi:hypothetical protein